MQDRYLKNLRECFYAFQSIINHVTKDTAKLQNLSAMPKPIFYRNLKKLTQQGTIKRRQGNCRTRALNHNDEKSVCHKSIRSPLKSTLQITREVQTSRSANVSKSIVYRTLRKRNKSYVSVSEIADWFDTWTILVLDQCMWRSCRSRSEKPVGKCCQRKRTSPDRLKIRWNCTKQ